MRRVALSALLCGCISLANAQAPAGADKLTPQAVAESLAVLHMLDSVVVAHPKDAASWYRRGMVGWALYERDRNKPPIAGLDWTQLGQLADTSLRLAAQLDPKNPAYRTMAGRYLLNSGVSITRVASYGFFEAALDAAREGGDKHTIAEAAVEAGRTYWRQYDTHAHRWMLKDSMVRPDCFGSEAYNSALDVGKPKDPYASNRRGARLMRTTLDQTAVELPANESGESDYLQAETLFREAFEAEPGFERAFRQFAMLLAERDRWGELSAAARLRVQAAPRDAWAWLTLGLATHRLGSDPKFAAVAFDSALRLLPVEERQRLDRLERVLSPKDTARLAASPAASRDAYQNLYWLSSDQLWSRAGNEPRVEFLARVTYAELRWTVEELKVRGADSDRGDVHIRYGPPELIAVLPPIVTPPDPTHPELPFPGDVCTIWSYDIGMTFYFTGKPTFATAQIPLVDRKSVAEMVTSNPVRFDNVNKGYRIDAMPVQAARFRASNDSVDFVVATLPPSDSIRKAADVDGPVRADFWLVNGALATVVHDSVIPSVTGVRTFSHRVASGAYFFRAEATADGSRYASRVTAPLVAMADSASGFTMRGFGISDVLVTTAATPRGSPRQWSDFAVTPLVGAAARNTQLTLVWENYELGDQANSARYAVTLLLQRQQTAVGRIAAQITGPLARSVGVQRTDDQIVMQFERTVAYASALVDNIALSLGDSPAGTYRMTLTVVDHVTGRTTSRTFPLVIRQ